MHSWLRRTGITNLKLTSNFQLFCSIKYQLSLAKSWRFLGKKGMGISPDPLGGGCLYSPINKRHPEEKGLQGKTISTN